MVNGDKVPTVSVLMAVYNDGAYVATAIDSILAQTFGDFEFIIVDDGSADGSWDIIRDYAARDGRIRAVRNPRNLGFPDALNRGLALARGKFIARHDSDDTCSPARFARQMEYLQAHPQVDVLGTQLQLVDESGKKTGVYTTPLSHSLIVWNILIDRPLGHATAFMRRELLRAVGGYDPAWRYSEDLDLWTRLAGRARFANLPDVLYTYRILPKSVCRRRRVEQAQQGVLIRARFAEQVMKRPVPLKVLRWLRDFVKGYRPLSSGQCRQVAAFLEEMFVAMRSQRFFLEAELPEVEADLGRRLSELQAAAERKRRWWEPLGRVARAAGNPRGTLTRLKLMLWR